MANHAVADEHGEQHRRQGVEGDDDTLGEEGNRGGGAERAGEAATGQDDDIIGEEDDGAEQHMQQHDEGAGDMNGKESAEGRRGSGRKKRRRETRSLNRAQDMVSTGPCGRGRTRVGMSGVTTVRGVSAGVAVCRCP